MSAPIVSAQSRVTQESNSNLVPHSIRALRLKQVQSKTGLSRSSIYAKSKTGEFPSPIKLGGGRASAWLEHEIEQWLQQQVIDTRGGH